MFKDKQAFEEEFKQRIIETYGEPVEETHSLDHYTVLSHMVRDYASINWKDSKVAAHQQNAKKVYYFSMEFLLGRSLKNNLMNLGIYDMVDEGLQDMGISLQEMLDIEPDAGLGNGGLGRLAACYMDSAATLNYPVCGNCIRYQYGLFRQKINEKGEQVEMPDMWLKFGNPWELAKPKHAVDVRFWGHVNVTGDMEGNLHFDHVDATKVRAVPYDMPMIGAGTKMVNTLRLWSAEPAEDIPAGVDYQRYLSEVSEICQNVYPDDSTEHGKFLRLKQQYFFVAAGIHTIIEDHLKNYPDLDNLPDMVAIQLNDTHPVLAVAELMRILMDEHGYPWRKAWDITHEVISYTNHTIMSEALEIWPCSYVEKLLPRIYMIIQEIDREFGIYVRSKDPSGSLLNRTRIIDGGMIHMARLAVITSHSVNGVAAIHTEILKKDLFASYEFLFPGRLNNKTNGISPRRWLLNADPELSSLIEEAIGPDFRQDAGRLETLQDHVDSTMLQEKFLSVKKQRKEILADFIRESTGIEVDTASIFDIQAKRLHAYKRQLLNILHVIYLYQRMKADPAFRITPHTWIFAAKAAPSYLFAKKVIQLINCAGRVINADPDISRYMKVIFLPDYRVTMSEVLVGGTDISEQISMAGKEASGTGNMKFMMNGAITLGTLDGANVEIDQLVGRENDVIFGLKENEIPGFRPGYKAWNLYMQDNRIRHAMDTLIDGTWTGHPDTFRAIYDEVLGKNDEYFVLADFNAYVEAQEEIVRRYGDRSAWARSCLINIARSGYFSSDRAVKQYAEEIWHIKPLRF